MHIRTLKNLITLLQRVHAHLMRFQSRTSRLNTVRDKRTRRTRWRRNSSVDEGEHGVSTDFVGFDVEVLHFGEAEVFGCNSLVLLVLVFATLRGGRGRRDTLNGSITVNCISDANCRA